jgi:hypothetical protein
MYFARLPPQSSPVFFRPAPIRDQLVQTGNYFLEISNSGLWRASVPAAEILKRLHPGPQP